MGIFDHDNRGVDHRTYRDRDAAQTHDVRRNAQIIHADEGDDNRHRERENNHEGARQMEEKYKTNNAHRDRELDDLFLKRIDRPVDEIGPVIGGDNLHALRQRRLNVFRYLLLHPFDHIQDILPETDDNDAACDLALAVQFRKPPPDLGAELDCCNITQEDRGADAVRAEEIFSIS